jgi:hypothetical protein
MYILEPRQASRRWQLISKFTVQDSIIAKPHNPRHIASYNSNKVVEKYSMLPKSNT